MARRTPTLQSRAQYHRYWGVLDGGWGPEWMPGTANVPLVGTGSEGVLEVGDSAMNGRDGMQYHCVRAPTAGNDDALWIATALLTGAVGSDILATSLDNTRYYTYGSDPIGGLAAGTIVLLAQPQLGDFTNTNEKDIFGTRNNQGAAAGGGMCFTVPNSFNPISLGYRFCSNTPVEIDFDTGQIRYLPGKMVLFGLTWASAGGGLSRQCRFFVNQDFRDERDVLGTVLGIGGDLTLGTSAAGAMAAGREGMNEGWIHGAAFVDRAFTVEEFGEFSARTLDLGFIWEGVSGGWDEGWHIGMVDPAGTIESFTGGTDLTIVNGPTLHQLIHARFGP